MHCGEGHMRGGGMNATYTVDRRVLRLGGVISKYPSERTNEQARIKATVGDDFRCAY